MKKEIVAIDLFCGAGGLTRGLLDAGVDVVAGIDVDTYAEIAYKRNNVRKNLKECKYIKQDITSVSGKYLKSLIGARKGKYFLLAGCAPCQPFSAKNANRHYHNDERKSLLLEFARLINETKPDFVFMENVPGITKLEPAVFNSFLETLYQNGFERSKIAYQVINAKDYGVPQNRKRFVLLASKHKKIKIPAPMYSSDNYKTVRQTIGALPEISAGQTHSTKILHKSAGLSDINLERIHIIKRNREELPEHLILNCHKKTKGHKDAYGRMDWDKPSPTLTTKFFSITNGRYGHPSQDRGISLLEGALLQSFREDYIFYGNTQAVARQIGNAVPPEMAKNLAKAFE